MKVIIVGGGQVGEHVGKLLIDHKCDVTIIENRECIMAKLRQSVPEQYLLEGSGADPKTLEEAGIANTDVVVAVSGADEVNLVTSTVAKFEYMVPRVIARVNNPKNEWMFTEQMGVDVHLNQANILAHLVVDEIDLKNLFTLFKLDRGKNSIVRFSVDAGAPSVGKNLKDLELPEDTLLIGIRRGENFHVPKGDTVIEPNDQVMALVNQETMGEVENLFEAKN